MEIYAMIGAAIIGVMGLLWAALKIKSAQAEKSDALAKVAQEEFEAADREIKATEKRLENLHVVRSALAEKHRVEQKSIDSGKRDAFDTNDF